MSKQDTRSRSFVVVINNPTDEDYIKFMACETAYKCWAPEVGEEGTPHLQGYLYFKEAKSFSKIKKLLPRAHIETCEGNAKQNRTYIFGPYENDGKTKPVNPLAQEVGTLPKQGKRTDIDVVREELSAGNGMRGVVKKASNLQQIKIAEAILKYEEPQRTWKTEVHWYFGLTGTGKSKRAHECFEGKDFFRKTCSSKEWWDGYDAHEYVILDDFVFPEKMHDYKYWLDVFDRYGTTVQIKGSTRQLLAKEIIVTSSVDPRIALQNHDQGGAEFLRRITSITEFL